MENQKQNGYKHHLHGLEQFFDTYLREKVPFKLPAEAKEFIVTYGPWITLVLLVISALVIVPLVLLSLGLSVVAFPLEGARYYHGSLFGALELLITVVSLFLEAAAIPGLLKRKISAWYLVYYAALLSALSTLLSLNLVNFVVGLVLSMYVLFQIKEYYK